ncbi:MAG: 3-methyl-2-oxobutanoate hydroxymethyltransferase [Hydrogenophilus sp.]|nr:3-methyl-2-oxobutanoate hydroxymethyltransferase [Hydrogenophilus sp.]
MTDATLSPLTLTKLRAMRDRGEKIAALTSYDATFAALSDRAGVDILLVGDSLGNVIQGHRTTLPVTLDHLLYHTAAVARGSARCWIIADLPFATYQQSPQQAFSSAAQLLQAGAHMVKIEGGLPMVETVRFLVERGIPVCAHIGFTPQSIHQIGGPHVQGKRDADAERLRVEAAALEAAGASIIILELIPRTLAHEITRRANEAITIGIGAGPECDGQILVLYDLLGITLGKPPRFVKNFMESASSIEQAIRNYVQAVKTGRYPAEEHCY